MSFRCDSAAGDTVACTETRSVIIGSPYKDRPHDASRTNGPDVSVCPKWSRVDRSRTRYASSWAHFCREMGKQSSMMRSPRVVGFGWYDILRANWTVASPCLVDVRGIEGSSRKLESVSGQPHVMRVGRYCTNGLAHRREAVGEASGAAGVGQHIT